MPGKRISGTWIAATLTIVGLILGCAGTGINKGDFSLISIQEEWQLGAQFSADIAQEMRLLEDPEIKAYITRLGEDVLAQAGGDTPVAAQPWSFHVIAEDQVNAFNIPGGHVYFYSGLISRADNYGELMGVMAHEVSHGLARHGVENMSKQYGISMVASLVLGQNPKVYEEVLANILAGGAIMKFSRSAEAEADRLGAGYMYRAGADPMGMVFFFRKLLDLRPSKPNGIEQFFSSHPLTEDRIRDTEILIQSFPAKPLTLTDAGFEKFMRAVTAAGS